VHIRKAGKIPQADFVPWTAAYFQTRETRDRFLLRVASILPVQGVEAEAMVDQCRGARVRWRPGKFLGLNDVAYAHGGRIFVASTSAF
jgi:hypothetical protein